METAPQRWITWRALLVGLALMPAVVAWNYVIEVVFYCFATYAAPFFNIVFILFVLTLLNLLVGRFAPRRALAPRELIVVYAMLCLQGALASHNMMEILITLLPHPYRYATPENHWADLFIDRLPRWAMVPYPEAYEDHYRGNSTFWTPIHLAAWIRPALVWCPFATVLLLTMLCLTAILRRRWIEEERLSYPVLQLPLALIDRPREILASKMLWAGFAVAATLSLLAGLHEILPALPAVPVGRYSMARYFATAPWTVLRGMRWAVYPWAIGIGFLIPLDLAASCWLFYFGYCAERVIGEWLGWSRSGGFPWAYDQAFGAYLAILVMGLWVGRHHFGAVLRSALTFWRPATAEERTYRLAVWGAVAGTVYLVWFGSRLGVDVAVGIAFFLVYFALATMITRIRAELGFPTHDMHEMSPPLTFTRLFAPRVFTPGTLVGFTMLWWFNRVYASHPMPHQLEAFKLADETRSSPRSIALAVAVAAIAAPWLLFLIVPSFYYHLGAESARVNQWGTGFGHEAFRRLEGWLTSPSRFDASHLVATAGGFAIALALGAVRIRWIGWPLHPLAYAIANSWGMEQLWLPLILATTIKALMLRYGGLSLYRRWIPFFLGLTLGDFIAGSLWNLAGMAFDFHPYDFWPGVIKN